MFLVVLGAVCKMWGGKVYFESVVLTLVFSKHFHHSFKYFIGLNIKLLPMKIF